MFPIEDGTFFVIIIQVAFILPDTFLRQKQQLEFGGNLPRMYPSTKSYLLRFSHPLSTPMCSDDRPPKISTSTMQYYVACVCITIVASIIIVASNSSTMAPTLPRQNHVARQVQQVHAAALSPTTKKAHNKAQQAVLKKAARDVIQLKSDGKT